MHRADLESYLKNYGSVLEYVTRHGNIRRRWMPFSVRNRARVKEARELTAGQLALIRAFRNRTDLSGQKYIQKRLTLALFEIGGFELIQTLADKLGVKAE